MNCQKEYQGSLKGQFLIAMPGLADPNFHQTVSYICEHTPQGAMGLIINRVHPDLTMGAVFKELNLESIPERDSLHIHLGGPVHTEQIFILHGPPFDWEACHQVTSSLALSNSKDVLEAIAKGGGPNSFIIAIGCGGWGPGQLEAEIMANTWLTCPASEEILFEIKIEDRWRVATRLLGIDPERLTSAAGHA
ncbi:MAG: YqgE/AlgH family protein [Deltaproteobacteria bacterium]|nr:YqgE/AlgH family protein [Deltaproteobacteria bacterium]